jgi:hypothetical protein
MLLLLILLVLPACSAASSPNDPTTTIAPAVTLLPATVTVAPSAVPSNTPQPTEETQAPTQTITATQRPSATETPEPTTTAVPTYVKMRGKVIIDQAVCHYGPGAPYLYKYGVYKDSNLEILRRIEYGNYVEVQAIGGDNRCWVRADYFELKGNYLDLEPVSAADVPLPITPITARPAESAPAAVGTKLRFHGTRSF